jgi:HEAT repeat protein
LKDQGDVVGLIKALSYAKDPGVCKEAVEALGEIGDSRAVEPLIAVLNSDNKNVRLVAAKALVKIGDPRVVEPLVAALKDMDRDVAEAAADALGQIGDARTVEPLVAALKDKDKRVRRAAARALSLIGDARAVEPLVAALKDMDGDVRRPAARALKRLDWQPDQGAAGAAYWIGLDQWDRCVQIGAPAVEPLAAALRDEDKDVRRAAAQALGQISDARAVEPLIVALKDKDEYVREAATDALGRIGVPAVEPLVAALRDEDKDVRRAAARALGQIGDARAVPPLIAAWGDKDGDVRQRVSQALAEVGLPAVEAHVVAQQKESGTISRLAARALDRVGWQPGRDEMGAAYWAAKRDWDKCAACGAPAVGLLMTALRDRDSEVRDGARKALAKVGLPAVEPLIKALQDGDQDVQEAAAAALGMIGDERARAPLTSLAQRGKGRVQTRARRALAAIEGTKLAGGILFSQNEGYRSRLRLINADGTGQKVLGEGCHPAWSPDGTKIAYAYERASLDIYVMNADGSDSQALTRYENPNTPDSEPTWSPDGKWIAFTSERDSRVTSQIYVMEASGASQRRLTQSMSCRSPAWSPDGEKIAFIGGFGLYGHRWDVYLMNPDGSQESVLVRNGFYPAWSPDGSRIAYVSDQQIHLVNRNGKGKKRLTRLNHGAQRPAWSPDGEQIAFISGPSSDDQDVYIMGSDGSDVRRLTNNRAACYGVAWQPWILPEFTVPEEVPDAVAERAVAQCQFCGKELLTSTGETAVQQFGGSIDDAFATMQRAAEEMLAEKNVCASCGAVFCLECGNAKGRKLGTGATHCPGCGVKVAI